MSKLNDLILQYCPDGVEYRPLGEVCEIKTGKLNANAMEPNGIYPFFTCSESVYTINSYAFDCEALLIAGNGYIGNVKHYKGKFNAYQRTYVLTDFVQDLLVRYLYFYLLAYFRDYALSMQREGSVPYITLGVLQDFEIPLPPLPVQEEIVRILDNFSLLSAELEAELEGRRKQFDFYRSQLLSFDANADSGSVQWKTLGEIGKVCMCKRILKDQTSTAGDVPFFKIGTFGKEPDAYISNELFQEYKSKYSYPKVGDILISASGTIGRTVIFDGKPSYFQDSNIVWLNHDESIVLNSYLRYCYTLNPWKVSTGGTISRLYNDNILNAVIPIPPLAEQQRIVDILDRFDALTNDLTQGLPAEIEARKKQYEHYRDKLLTFKRKEA